jgi:hypothetical protein
MIRSLARLSFAILVEGPSFNPTTTNVLILFLMWCYLAVIAWPVALLALFMLPIVWLLVLPFRILAVVVVVIAGFPQNTVFAAC